jgi:hypothetical protein
MIELEGNAGTRNLIESWRFPPSKKIDAYGAYTYTHRHLHHPSLPPIQIWAINDSGSTCNCHLQGRGGVSAYTGPFQVMWNSWTISYRHAIPYRHPTPLFPFWHLSSHTFSHFCSRFSFISVALAGPVDAEAAAVRLRWLMISAGGYSCISLAAHDSRAFSLFISPVSSFGPLRPSRPTSFLEVDRPSLRPNDYGHQLCKWMSLIKKATYILLYTTNTCSSSTTKMSNSRMERLKL